MKNKEILERLRRAYPDAGPELVFSNPFELLVATILSAQTTDVQVNKVTKELFKKYPTPFDLKKVEPRELEDDIRTIGLYKNKSKYLVECANQIVEKFGGKVPDKRSELMSLSGVGRKTANVVLSNAFEIPAIAVDTHVFRVSKRLGLAFGDSVEKVERELMENIPEESWGCAHHWLIWHGRRVCQARKPKCDECPLKDLCRYYGEELLD